jgi:hypothetical protein
MNLLGGRDGCVRLWDIRVKEPVLALEPGEGQPVRDCWTVAFGNSFSDEERCIAAGIVFRAPQSVNVVRFRVKFILFSFLVRFRL